MKIAVTEELMKKNRNGRNAFIRMMKRSSNDQHALFGVPLTFMLGAFLLKTQEEGIKMTEFELSIIVTKVGMESHIEEILDYCANWASEAKELVYQYLHDKKIQI
jgi:hypothetical protein